MTPQYNILSLVDKGYDSDEECRTYEVNYRDGIEFKDIELKLDNQGVLKVPDFDKQRNILLLSALQIAKDTQNNGNYYYLYMSQKDFDSFLKGNELKDGHFFGLVTVFVSSAIKGAYVMTPTECYSLVKDVCDCDVLVEFIPEEGVTLNRGIQSYDNPFIKDRHVPVMVNQYNAPMYSNKTFKATRWIKPTTDDLTLSQWIDIDEVTEDGS